MKNKSLWRISVATSLEAEDAVGELLGTIFNRSASSHFDVEKQTSVVSVFCESKPSQIVREEILAGLRRIKNCGLKIGAWKIKIARVRREDWAESWKRHFKPIEIKCNSGARTARPRVVGVQASACSATGKLKLELQRGRVVCAPAMSLLVKPSWSKKRPRKNQAVVILDPGLSFGTGQHPTTEFCLREIVAAVGRPPQIPKKMKDAALCRGAATKSFLDIGTGSGILAIAAAKLGFRPVRAFDFDHEAVRVARANARVNGVARKLKISRGDVAKLSMSPSRRFDLICANLISNLLIAERRRIAAQLNPGGILVLAGILKSEFAEVQKEFEFLGLKLVSAKSEKEWRSGVFCFAEK
jgi:ribosomal protein L11 methyltransferase